MKPSKPIESLILTLRGQKVILDTDLALLYGVPTKVFNQAVKRNSERFPADFTFQLTIQEWDNLKSQIVTSSLVGGKFHEPAQEYPHNATNTHGGRRKPPHAFTEHGAIMAATVLNSTEAVAMSVFVVRAFMQMREQLAANAAILKRMAEIDRTLLEHDTALSSIWKKLQPLLAPPPPVPEPPKRRIGFNAENK